MEENTNNKNLDIITGYIEMALLAVHMEAASDDTTRKVLQALHMECAGGTLHIVTCDGRKLLHTELHDAKDRNGELLPNFVADVCLPHKLKVCAKYSRAMFTVDLKTKIFRLQPTGAPEQIYPLLDDSYPNWRQVEVAPEHSVAAHDFTTFDPDYMKIVRKYMPIGWLYAYTTEQINPTTGEPILEDWDKPHGFYERCTVTEERYVTIMPLRTSERDQQWKEKKLAYEQEQAKSEESTEEKTSVA